MRSKYKNFFLYLFNDTGKEIVIRGRNCDKKDIHL